MKSNNLFKMLKKIFRTLLLPTHGKLLKHEVQVPAEIAEFKKEVFDLNMRTQREDKVNLKNDLNKVKKGVKKSFHDYHTECV